ncbi:Histone ubiquitination protein [Gracilaria domingensis]|nr:Histone ubiquitination protein [Gracilaria domingensis]
MPVAVKNLTGQTVLAIEQISAASIADMDASRPSAELHRRLGEVSNHLERYAERDKQSLVSSAIFRSDANNADDPNTSISALVVAYDSKALKGANALSDKRLEELIQLQQKNKRLISENEALRADVSERDGGIVPIKTILNTELYQTMEVNLQQLYLNERSWQMEKEAQNEQQEEERKHALEQLAEAKASAEKTIEDLRRQMNELPWIADAAMVEKDKVLMTYEARKMDAGAAAAVIKAAEKRTKVCEEMRNKL